MTTLAFGSELVSRVPPSTRLGMGGALFSRIPLQLVSALGTQRTPRLYCIDGEEEFPSKCCSPLTWWNESRSVSRAWTSSALAPVSARPLSARQWKSTSGLHWA